MKHNPVTFVLTMLSFCAALHLAPAARAQFTEVVPNEFANTPATATFLGPLANGQRTYQMLIHQDQLTSLAGLQLNGLTWRLPGNATGNWPASDITFNDFDIYLSGSVAPADRSLTFADNVVGSQTQVRSGALTIPADTFTFGDTPNNFGFNIGFTPWLYSGGHLLVELRHTGFTGTSRSIEAVGTAHPGYLNQFAAAWTANYAGTSGSQGNFAVTQFSAIPEPSGILALAAAALGLTLVRRRTPH